MLMNCKLKANLKGTVDMLGQEVPVNIEVTVKIVGRKIN